MFAEILTNISFGLDSVSSVFSNLSCHLLNQGVYRRGRAFVNLTLTILAEPLPVSVLLLMFASRLILATGCR